MACAAVLQRHVTGDSDIRFFSSPLGRAYETSKIVCCELDISHSRIVKSGALAELDYGQWQGIDDEEIDARFPGQRKKRYTNHWQYQQHGGESYAMAEQRIVQWFESVQGNQQLIVVAHEMINRVLLMVCLGLSTQDALKHKHPHGAVFKLHDGAVDLLR